MNKTSLFAALAAGFSLSVLSRSSAADAAAAPAAPAAPAASAASSPIAKDLEGLVGRIQEKLRAGKRTEADLAGEIAEFDALLAKYKGQKTEEVAEVALMKAMLYVEVFDDYDKGLALVKQLQADFPDTKLAHDVTQLVDEITPRIEAKKKQQEIIGKAAPLIEFQWATRDNLKSLADLKGKVVVLDFWATWCGPCVASFPEVRALVDHYKGYDVEVVGVTSIQGRVTGLEPNVIDCRGDVAKELGLMPAYVKAKDITWTVAFSKEDVFDPNYGIIGIPYMAIVAPDGTVRHAGLHPAGVTQEEKVKMIDALLKEFGLKVPTT